MSNIEFDSDVPDVQRSGSSSPRPGFGGMSQSNGSQKSGMAGWLIRHGWVRSENAAQIFLIGIIVVNVVATIILLKYFL